MAKRAFDIIFSYTVLVFGFPLFLILGLIVKLSSKGPVLFKQVRIGEKKKPFVFYKFRTMYMNNNHDLHKEYVKELITSNKKAGNAYKIEKDPRVTPIGRFLRRTSLDELPQFFNVLKGDMSVIGPRPPIPYELRYYKDWHFQRLETKPGITGLWQVSGRTLLPFDEMVRLDIEYSKKRSFALDLYILIKTIPAIIAGKGAY
ncbi:MAG: sugar transferase [Candidatus Hydrothermae bacterium]|nr:sugar transferase [Candidatus Hydrothermae bacterium]